MAVRIYQLPFIFTLIAQPLAWVVGFSIIWGIVWIPEILTLLAFVCLASIGKLNLSIKKTQIFIICLFGVHLLHQVLSGQGSGGSSIISVTLMSLLFVNFLKTSPAKGLVKNIISQVSIIYIIHISFILFEVLLINTGNVNFLRMLPGGKYETDFASYYIVPQSLFKQSQAASQISIFAMTWFLYLFFFRKKLMTIFKVRYTYVLIASFLVIALYLTTTALIVGIVLLFLTVYLIPYFPKSKLWRFLVLITGVIFFKPIYQALTYKMHEDYVHAMVYRNAFYDPIGIFLEQPLFSQLWGVGGMESVNQIGIEHADFGIGISVLQVGIVLMVVAISACFTLVLRMLLFSYSRQFNNHQCFPWIWLGSVNALLVVGNLLSLVHYTVALQMGGRALFSLHIAIVILSLQRLVLYRRSLKAVVS